MARRFGLAAESEQKKLRIEHKAVIPTSDSIVLAQAVAGERDTALAADTSWAENTASADLPFADESAGRDFRLANKDVADTMRQLCSRLRRRAAAVNTVVLIQSHRFLVDSTEKDFPGYRHLLGNAMTIRDKVSEGRIRPVVERIAAMRKCL